MIFLMFIITSNYYYHIYHHRLIYNFIIMHTHSFDSILSFYDPDDSLLSLSNLLPEDSFIRLAS